MNINRENIDDLNAILTIDIEKDDYQPQVDKILKDYRKTANIPGFRKGHVPMGMIKKQYGKAVLIDEVNKILQNQLNQYLTDEKLKVLGNPLPKEREHFSWEDDHFSFDFEIGLAPEFKVDLTTELPVTYYKIVADKEMVEKQITHLRTQYGKLKSKTKIDSDKDLISGIFTNEENKIEEKTTFSLEKIKKSTQKKFKELKLDETISLEPEEIFESDQELSAHLGRDEDQLKNISSPLEFTLTEISEQELAELNEDFFKKIYGADTTLKTEEEFRAKIKEEIEKNFVQQSDQQFLNDITESLIEETKFDLPQEFLQRWIKVSGENELSQEEAQEEYFRSEKGLRYQLIENQLLEDFEVKIEAEDIMKITKEQIKLQMAQFGRVNPSDDELNGIAQRVLSNTEELQNFSEQAKTLKLLELFKEKANIKEKEVTFDAFLEEMTQKEKKTED